LWYMPYYVLARRRTCPRPRRPPREPAVVRYVAGVLPSVGIVAMAIEGGVEMRFWKHKRHQGGEAGGH